MCNSNYLLTESEVLAGESQTEALPKSSKQAMFIRQIVELESSYLKYASESSPKYGNLNDLL